jgi:AraC family transcriptional regulator
MELNKVADYIENHLEEKIDYKEISKMIGVNEYTFQKIFSVICDISITEYIRNRRLSNAGQEIYLKNEKVIDMAVRYQYENATSFSRAFEKFHGIKPSEVRKKPEKLKMYTKLHFNEITEQSKNVEYKIIEKEQIILYGKYKNTNNERIREDAPRFFNKIKNQYGEPPYGMVEYKDKERLYVKAYWVLYNQKVQGLEQKIIPKSKWIMIRIKSQEAKEIQEVSKLFYYDFLPSCKYNFKDLPEIEYYHDGVTDFLVPIED